MNTFFCCFFVFFSALHLSQLQFQIYIFFLSLSVLGCFPSFFLPKYLFELCKFCRLLFLLRIQSQAMRLICFGSQLLRPLWSVRWQTIVLMCANVPNDAHLNDENTVHTEDKVQHVDREDRQHSQKAQTHRPMMMAVPLGYLHPYQDSVFSILYDDFGTKFLPVQRNSCETKTHYIISRKMARKNHENQWFNTLIMPF